MRLGLGLGFQQLAATTTPAPSVSSITPDLGDVDGGIAVTITGSHFATATGATIGGVAVTSFVVVNGSTITCKTPAKVAGVYDVAVTSPSGTGTLAGGFESWYPSQLSGAPLVFDAEKGITQAGGLVSKWADQGGGGNDLTAATTARPTYTATDFGTRHGLAFDGVANVMTLTDQPFGAATMLVVAKVSDATDTFWSFISGVSGGVHPMGYDRTSIVKYDADTATIYSSIACGVNDGVRRCVSLTSDGGSGDLKFYMNGAQVGPTQTNTYGARGHFSQLCQLGGTFTAAHLGCVVFVPAVVSAGDLVKLHTWAIGKFVT